MLSTVWKKLVLSLALTAAVTSTANAAVWEATESWNDDWETRYSEWVRTKWDHHFFTREGTPYTGLKLDCADTVYTMRIIFAYEHSLPFQMKDATGGRNPISNKMSRWDKEADSGKRIRSFLQFIFGVASTHSLPADTYPVAVSREGIRSGGLLLTDKKSHHSWTIRDISKVGIPHLVYSSRPAKTEIKYKIGFPSVSFTFPAGIKESTHAGFRYFRQPEWIGKSVWDVPGYSKEQYQIPAASWRKTVQSKIAFEVETDQQAVDRLLTDTCQAATERVQIVNEALAHLAKVGARCLNATEYDDHSTPSRDERMMNAFQELDLALVDAKAKIPADFCTIEYAPGKSLTLAQVRQRSLTGALSNNPHDSVDYRWGARAGHGTMAKRCPVFH